MIKAIDASSVHRICSGQVILDLATAVKELVENAIDAEATSIEVKLRGYGAVSIEVIDNGTGIPQEAWEVLARKHTTSKISNFADLDSVLSYGFRGEALSSLCGVATLTVTTATSNGPSAMKLVYNTEGELESKTAVAREVGTTVVVNGLFSKLPVRLSEFQKNVRRDYAKTLTLLQSYAIANPAVRFKVSSSGAGDRAGNGAMNSQLSTPGGKTSQWSVLGTVLGRKVAEELIPLVSADDRVKGWVSRPQPGALKGGGGRQMWLLNGRPVDLPRFTLALNEAFRSHVAGASPMSVISLTLPPESYDVNVTPDKRKVMMVEESELIGALRAILDATWTHETSSMPLNVSGSRQGALTPMLISTQATPSFSRSSSQFSVSSQGDGDSQASSLSGLHSASPSPALGAQEPRASQGSLGAARLPGTVVVKEERQNATLERLSRSSSTASASEALSRWANGAASGVRVLGRSDSTSSGGRPPLGKRRRSLGSGSGRSLMEALAAKVGDLSESSQSQSESQTDGDEFMDRETAVGHGVDAGMMMQKRSLKREEEEEERLSKRQAVSVPAVEPVMEGWIGSQGTRQGDDGGDDFTSPLNQAGSGEVLVLDARGNMRRLSGPQGEGSGEGRGADPSLLDHGHISSDEENGDSGSRYGEDVEDEDKVILDFDLDPMPSLVPGADIELGTTLDDIYQGHSMRQELLKMDVGGGVSRSDGRGGDDDEMEGAGVGKGQAEETLKAVFHKTDFHQLRIVGQFNLGFIIALRRADLVGVPPPDHVLEPTPQLPARAPGPHRPGPVGGEPASSASSASTGSSKEPVVINIDSDEEGEEEVDGETTAVGGNGEKPPLKRAPSDGVGSKWNGPSALPHRAEVGDLFIIDQHASDEKWNYENLRATAVIQTQPLIQPLPLNLSASLEAVAMSAVDICKANGFSLEIREDAPSGQRVFLKAVPALRSVNLGVADVMEILHVLNDDLTGGVESAPSGKGAIPSSGVDGSGLGRSMVRCTKINAVLASKACRTAYMVGTALSREEMRRVITHMGRMDNCWSCPHGRPTMRHLHRLNPEHHG